MEEKQEQLLALGLQASWISLFLEYDKTQSIQKP